MTINKTNLAQFPTIEKNVPNYLDKEIAPYAMVPTEILNGVRHGLALAIYCHLYGKPINWQIRRSELGRQFRVGKDSIANALKYLKDRGLYSVSHIKAPDGKIIGSKTRLHLKILNPDIAPDRVKYVNKDPENTKLMPYKNTLNAPEQNIYNAPNAPNAPEQNIYNAPPQPLCSMDLDNLVHRVPEIQTLGRSGSIIKIEVPLQKKEKEKRSCALHAPAQILESFKNFWEVYPNKKGKKEALTVFEKHKLYEKVEEIIACVKTQIASEPRWRDEGGKYIPMAKTYLRNERWDDVNALIPIKPPVSAFKGSNYVPATSIPKEDDRAKKEALIADYKHEIKTGIKILTEEQRELAKKLFEAQCPQLPAAKPVPLRPQGVNSIKDLLALRPEIRNAQ